MGTNLTEFLFAQLLLILVTGIMALVAYMLKRHVNTTDALGAKVGILAENVARLLDRDRMHRLADYRIADEKNGDGD